MSNNRLFSFLGAVLATPSLTASMAPAMQNDVDPRAIQGATAPGVATDRTIVALKAEMLGLSPAEKLAIAGDRLGSSFDESSSRAGAHSVLKGGGAYYADAAAPLRTNTNIPECQGSNVGVKGAGATGVDTAPRTNTDIPECHSPSMGAKGSGATGFGTAPRTNTDIPECLSPSMGAKGSGATGFGTAPRTNTDIPECLSPSVGAKGSGATGFGTAPRTNTDIPECHTPDTRSAPAKP